MQLKKKSQDGMQNVAKESNYITNLWNSLTKGVKEKDADPSNWKWAEFVRLKAKEFCISTLLELIKSFPTEGTG